MTRDPFLCDGPTVVSFSGGRTSGLMLRRILDAHGGALPPDVYAVFANTGRERVETLRFVADCARQWNVPVRWIERDGAQSSGERWREVEYETASRAGEPFAELIASKRFLPNVMMRFCTQELKIRPMRDFMKAQGHDLWTNIVGLRRDEPRRVAKLRSRDNVEWDVACPLYDADVTVADVAAFWRSQPFDLALKPWEGNCDLCFLKGRGVRGRIMRDRPDLASWWIAQEAAARGTFVKHEPNYAAALARVRSLPLLPMELDPDTDALPCACTD